jgi:hypothetical protein
MKIRITESQLTRILENSDLNSAFKNLKVGDILVLSITTPDGDHDYKFKIIEDMGESWKMVNLNFGSANTGFEWYIEKDESLSDAQVVLVKASKKDRKKIRTTLKNIMSAKLGDDILSLSTTGDVDIDDVKQSYELAIRDMSRRTDITPYKAHVAAIEVVRDEFGDIPEVEILNKGYKQKERKDPDEVELDAEDVDFVDVADIDEFINKIRANIGRGDGILLNLSGGAMLRYNIMDKSDSEFKLEMIETNSDEYENDINVDFIMKLDNSHIDLTPDNKVNLKLLIDQTDGYVNINSIIKIKRVDYREENLSITRDELLKHIQSNPVLSNAFAKTPKLLSLINVGDVKGISKAADLLSRSGFGLSKNTGLADSYKDKFVQNRRVRFDLLRDVNYIAGDPMVAGERTARVIDNSRFVKFKDTDRNTYKITKALDNDRYEVTVRRYNDSDIENGVIRIIDYRYD